MAESTQPENLRIRLEPPLKARFEKVTDTKGVSQQTAIVRLVRWFVDQEDLVQSMVLGQIAPTPDVMKAVIKQLGPKPPGKGRVMPPDDGKT